MAPGENVVDTPGLKNYVRLGVSNLLKKQKYFQYYGNLSLLHLPHHLFIQQVNSSLNEVFISAHCFSYAFTAPVCVYPKRCMALLCTLLNYIKLCYTACIFLQFAFFHLK